MTRCHRPVLLALCAAILPVLGQSCEDFVITIEFVVPDRAERVDTESVDLLEDTLVQVHNDLGSTRVTVDPNATEATIEIEKIALAATETEAEDLLDAMVVEIDEPTTGDNVLTIDATLPPEATDNQESFHFDVDEDELHITTILGETLVAQYRLRITLPPGHGVEVRQDVGPIRAAALDRDSTLDASAGSIRCVGAQAAVVATTAAGDIDIGSHQGALEATVAAGELRVEIASLGDDDDVTCEVDAGRIRIDLPAEIDASLRAWSDTGPVFFNPDAFTSATDVINTFGFVEATLGDGGPAIELTVSAGRVNIRAY